jgi:curved DNA-binding protein
MGPAPAGFFHQGGKAMEADHPFIDYYAILQVDPACSARTLEMAYRRLAKMFHPDHPETADPTRFNSITEAYSLLRKPEKRAGYDAIYARQTGYHFAPRPSTRPETMAAISDAQMHANILLYLYRKRRENSRHPGAGNFDILRSVNCADEHFEFHAWYLRKKGFIEHTEDGQYAITVEGVDHVIAMSEAAEKTLRITQAEDMEPELWAEPEPVGGTAH